MFKLICEYIHCSDISKMLVHSELIWRILTLLWSFDNDISLDEYKRMRILMVMSFVIMSFKMFSKLFLNKLQSLLYQMWYSLNFGENLCLKAEDVSCVENSVSPKVGDV